MSALAVRGLDKSFGDNQVLSQVGHGSRARMVAASKCCMIWVWRPASSV